MDKNTILKALEQSIKDVMGDQNQHPITFESSLRDMGANSVDRADILMQTMEILNIQVSMVSFAQAKNLGEIAMIIENACPKT